MQKKRAVINQKNGFSAAAEIRTWELLQREMLWYTIAISEIFVDVCETNLFVWKQLYFYGLNGFPIRQNQINTKGGQKIVKLGMES